MSATRRNDQPSKPPMHDYGLDAVVAALRAPGRANNAMRERLSARAYLLQHGWTVEQVNAARDAKEE